MKTAIFIKCFQKLKEMTEMNTIQIKGVGLLTEDQISNLISNARKMRNENEILKTELENIRRVQQ